MRCPVCGSFLTFIDRGIGLYECSQKGCVCCVFYKSEEKQLKEQEKEKEVLTSFVEETV